MTRVVNRKQTQAYDIYVGRPTIWGNPYKIGQVVDGHRLTRADVVAYYERWIRTQPALLAALPELRGKVLACWCAPLPCHANVLARLADESVPLSHGPTVSRGLSSDDRPAAAAPE